MEFLVKKIIIAVISLTMFQSISAYGQDSHGSNMQETSKEDAEQTTKKFELSREMLFRSAMFDRNYEIALKFAKDAFKVNTKYKDMPASTIQFGLYYTTAYLYVMLDRGKEFLENHEQISREIIQRDYEKFRPLMFHSQISIAIRLKDIDTALRLCEEVVFSDEENPFLKYRAYAVAGMCMHVKSDPSKARTYLLSAKKIHDEIKEALEISSLEEINDTMAIPLKVFLYYFNHLRDDYDFSFITEKPFHPEESEPDENGTCTVSYSYCMQFQIINKQTKKALTNKEIHTMIHPEQEKPDTSTVQPAFDLDNEVQNKSLNDPAK